MGKDSLSKVGGACKRIGSRIAKKVKVKKVLAVVDVSALDSEQYADLHRYLASAPNFLIVVYRPLLYSSVLAQRPSKHGLGKFDLLRLDTPTLKSELEAREPPKSPKDRNAHPTVTEQEE